MNAETGFEVFDHDADTARWARKAAKIGAKLIADPALRKANLRHQDTWFVGVDALPNAPDGSLDDVPLKGPWQPHVPVLPLHQAQLSVVFPGYPKQDQSESDANHKYRKTRHAAHVDGLLPIGPNRRRHALEHHAYILGLPLNPCEAAPTMVWPGSHTIMQDAIRAEIGANDPTKVDVTDAYQAARREVFAKIDPIPMHLDVGQAMLFHRFLLHGTAPWDTADAIAPHRMIAFFRPKFSAAEWLNAP